VSDFELGFIVGLVISLYAGAIVYKYADVNFEYREKRRAAIIGLCEKYNSIPDSYDTSTVKCVNGVSINYVIEEVEAVDL
jgi:hypothetical protein